VTFEAATEQDRCNFAFEICSSLSRHWLNQDGKNDERAATNDGH